MRTTLIEFIRLFVLVLFLPLALIAMGPLLILAVIRGRQQIGPITLNSAQYTLPGRAGIFMLGLVIWLAVWSGLAWFSLAAVSSPPVVAQLPLAATASPTAVSSALEPALVEPTFTPLFPATPTGSPTPPPTQTATATPLPPTPTQTATRPSATDTPAAAQTPASVLTGTLTEALTQTLAVTVTVTVSSAVTISNTPTATPTVEPGPTQTAVAEPVTPVPSGIPASSVTTGSTNTPVPLATLSLTDRGAALATVREGNILLRETLASGNEEDMEQLKTIWQDKAFTVIEAFAADLHQRYTSPIEVEFEYLKPPTVTTSQAPGQVSITSREKWSYGPENGGYQEAFEFYYTVTRQNDRWIITGYTFGRLHLASPTPASN